MLRGAAAQLSNGSSSPPLGINRDREKRLLLAEVLYETCRPQPFCQKLV